MIGVKKQVDNYEYEKEIKKLTSKIIELQDLIIARDNLIIAKEKEIKLAGEKGMDYYFKLSNECSEKNDKIYGLENEILKMKAVMARE